MAAATDSQVKKAKAPAVAAAGGKGKPSAGAGRRARKAAAAPSGIVRPAAAPADTAPSSSSSSASSAAAPAPAPAGSLPSRFGIDQTWLDDDGKPTTDAPGLPVAADGLHDHSWAEHKGKKGTFVTGKWTSREDEHLRRFFFDLAASSHGLSREEALRIVTEGVKAMGLHSKGFWLQLARRFRWRSVRDVFYHAQSALAAGEDAEQPWPEADLAALKAAEERHRDGKGKWAAVSREVGRPRGACRQQWNRAFGAEASSKRRGHWDGEEEAALRDAVAAQSSEEPSAVSWVRVAEAVSTRSSRECWEKWHRTSFGAEAEGRRWTAEHDAALVAALAEEDADTWSEVEWPALSRAAVGERTPDECKRRLRMLARQRAGGHALRPSALSRALRPGTARSEAPAQAASPGPAAKRRKRKAPGKTAAAKATPEVDYEEDVDGMVSQFNALLSDDDDDE